MQILRWTVTVTYATRCSPPWVPSDEAPVALNAESEPTHSFKPESVLIELAADSKNSEAQRSSDVYYRGVHINMLLYWEKRLSSPESHLPWQGGYCITSHTFTLVLVKVWEMSMTQCLLTFRRIRAPQRLVPQPFCSNSYGTAYRSVTCLPTCRSEDIIVV